MLENVFLTIFYFLSLKLKSFLTFNLEVSLGINQQFDQLMPDPGPNGTATQAWFFLYV